MARLITYTITESELQSTLSFTKGTQRYALDPLAGELSREYGISSSRPFVAALSGPPGSGKSAIASVLKILLEGGGLTAVVLPMDGFHLRNEVLGSSFTEVGGNPVSLLSVKGARETYDTEGLLRSLERLRRGDRFFWPVYSRTLHEPVERGIFIENRDTLYIVEGNFLLLDLNPWKGFSELFNRRIFIQSSVRLLRRRIITRKMRGGYSRAEAMAHFRRSDRGNISEVASLSRVYDYLLRHRARYRYTLVR
jgi:pantothenate kinase